MNRSTLAPALAFICLAACNANPSTTDAPSDQGAATTVSTARSPQVAFVVKDLSNPFWWGMEKGARKAAEEHGLELIVKSATSESSPEQQRSILEDLIAEKVAAIIIAPVDGTNLLPTLLRAQKAGIALVNVDDRLDPAAAKAAGLSPIPFVSVDNEKGAYLAAKYISDPISTHTKAMIVEGHRGAANALARKRGAMRAFTDNQHVEVVASEVANWKIDEAKNVVSQILQTHPDLGLVFCSNDIMALGAIKALEEAGRDDVTVSGYDAIAEAHAAIDAGKLAVSVDQQGNMQGYRSVQIAAKAIRGESVPAETMVDVALITAVR